MMTTASRSYLVECYTPGIEQPVVEATSRRAREVAEILRNDGRHIHYVNAIFVPADEVVFHVFVSDGPETVREASVAAEIPFERIIESVAVGEAAAPGPGGDTGNESPDELSVSGL